MGYFWGWVFWLGFFTFGDVLAPFSLWERVQAGWIIFLLWVAFWVGFVRFGFSLRAGASGVIGFFRLIGFLPVCFLVRVCALRVIFASRRKLGWGFFVVVGFGFGWIILFWVCFLVVLWFWGWGFWLGFFTFGDVFSSDFSLQENGALFLILCFWLYFKPWLANPLFLDLFQFLAC